MGRSVAGGGMRLRCVGGVISNAPPNPRRMGRKFDNVAPELAWQPALHSALAQHSRPAQRYEHELCARNPRHHHSHSMKSTKLLPTSSLTLHNPRHPSQSMKRNPVTRSTAGQHRLLGMPHSHSHSDPHSHRHHYSHSMKREPATHSTAGQPQRAWHAPS